MSTDFTSTFIVATKKFAEGEEIFNAYASLVPDVCGGTEEDFRAAFEAFRQKAACADSLKDIEKKAGAYRAPKSLISILEMGIKHITKFTVDEVKGDDDKVTTAGFKPRLSFIVELSTTKDKNDEEKTIGVLKVISGRVTTRSTGNGSKKGRISMMNAWKFGFKKGDKFKLETCDGGTKYFAEGSTVGRFIKKGDLTSFLKKIEGDSETIRHAASYSGMTSLH